LSAFTTSALKQSLYLSIFLQGINMSNTLTLIDNTGDRLVTFTSGKSEGTLSAEAALFKGGAALNALKDAALEVALSKAVNGRYRAACDILAVAFPSQDKAYSKLFKALPWSSKAEMGSYIRAMRLAEPGKSGEWNKKQVAARALLSCLEALPAFKVEAVEGEVVGETA
jgi:hypothetical protein